MPRIFENKADNDYRKKTLNRRINVKGNANAQGAYLKNGASLDKTAIIMNREKDPLISRVMNEVGGQLNDRYRHYGHSFAWTKKDQRKQEIEKNKENKS